MRRSLHWALVLLVVGLANSTVWAASQGASPKALYRAARANRPVVVVIDPGHGGHDSGTRAASGLEEKTVTLAIARHLYNKLRSTPGVRPVLTRQRDRYVSLRARVRIAQKHHANLFISIHENAFPDNTQVDGGTCYVLSEHGATDAKAAQLAHFENSADRTVAGVHFSTTDHTLNAVLTDLYQNASINDADSLAHDIIHHLARVEPIYRHTPPRANFAVLRDPMIPSVLCETAFLSNPHQARLLARRHFRAQLADAIYRGVMGYFKKHPPEKIQAVGGSVYTVRAGDTLSGIAARHGVSQQALMAINHLHRKQLRAGEKLQLPRGFVSRKNPPSQSYTVHSGDTLSGIAAAHNVTVAAIKRINDLSSSRLRIGQQLALPGGS